jgi:mercuric ion binding protein
MRNVLILMGAAVACAAALGASSRTAVLDVKNMTCGLCPVTVKKSLEKVAGVTEVRIDFGKKTATVAFDESKTNSASLVKATTDAGFPATVRP